LKIKEISIYEAINDTEEGSRNLLLGNGFSIALTDGCFSYENLFTKGKEKFPINETLQKKFETTYDFEEVMRELENGDLILINEFFLNALREVHPVSKRNIQNHYSSCLNLLGLFHNIFTTNYDLLLYWILMENKESSLTRMMQNSHGNSLLPCDDGFTRCSDKLIWKQNYANRVQNVFYLHGSMFIAHLNASYIKFKCTDTESILKQIEKYLKLKHYPLIVLEGSFEDKVNKISKHQYLSFCHNALKNLSSSLFLIGFSLNRRTDRHIIDSIIASKINKIYIGYYNFCEMQISIQESFSGTDKKIFIFDSQEALEFTPSRIK